MHNLILWLITGAFCPDLSLPVSVMRDCLEFGFAVFRQNIAVCVWPLVQECWRALGSLP